MTSGVILFVVIHQSSVIDQSNLSPSRKAKSRGSVSASLVSVDKIGEKNQGVLE